MWMMKKIDVIQSMACFSPINVGLNFTSTEQVSPGKDTGEPQFQLSTVNNADRSQFQSVLINIIINALDATEPEGNVNVSTATGFSQ